MRSFVDTSTLTKKYILETGREKFLLLLEQTSSIIVSPICWLEMNSVLHRRLSEKTLTPGQLNLLKNEISKDFIFFEKVIWTDAVEEKGLELLEKYNLRSLDAIQLAAACAAKPDIFITSDKRLFTPAKHELKRVELIV